MAEAAKATTKRRWRRRLLATAALFALLAGIGIAVERYVIRADRYIPFLVEEIERATQLPAGISRLDVASILAQAAMACRSAEAMEKLYRKLAKG